MTEPLPPSLPRGARRLEPSELAGHACTLGIVLGLTPTEALVAVGIWLGIGDKQIADWLERSVPTVHTHLQAIYRKLVDQGISRGRVALAVAVERSVAPSRNMDEADESDGGVRHA